MTNELKSKIQDGDLIPFLGMGVFYRTKDSNGTQLPHDSDSLILALNNGRAMSSRLMYEYSRAAMSLEQRKGREFIVQMTNHIYASKTYETPEVYKTLKALHPPYIIDLNLDMSSTTVYESEPHFMITGLSRITADYDRYIIYRYDPATLEYTRIDKGEFDGSLPIIFKPLGAMKPQMNFIISDADFVDWLTEAMGGYAIPVFLKGYRKDKSYLFMGVDFGRDTFRMVANEITLDLKEGWILTDKTELTKKEQKFADIHNLQFIHEDLEGFLTA